MNAFCLQDANITVGGEDTLLESGSVTGHVQPTIDGNNSEVVCSSPSIELQGQNKSTTTVLQSTPTSSVTSVASSVTSTSAASNGTMCTSVYADSSKLSGKRKKSNTVSSSPLKQTMQAYFSARTIEMNQNAETESDIVFGKMIASEIGRIANEDIKINLKKSISDLVFSARQAERSVGQQSNKVPLQQLQQQVFMPPQQQVLQFIRPSVATTQPACQREQSQFSVYLNNDGILQLADSQII